MGVVSSSPGDAEVGLERSTRPLVTVVVPVFNGGPTIADNIETIRRTIQGGLPGEDVEGVRRDQHRPDTLISRMHLADLRQLLEGEGIGGGMRPKLASCITALEGGVAQAHILDGRVQHALLLEIFTPEGVGTMVVP